jgi:hypothetical protein
MAVNILDPNFAPRGLRQTLEQPLIPCLTKKRDHRLAEPSANALFGIVLADPVIPSTNIDQRSSTTRSALKLGF